ncbi:flagellar hook-length control protein FliK [Thermoanaerobacterium sp. CMT5567-10]|uniref:flagellar hook-length control protein FliK n=1 Tax=Thermoanaerobacterium sp. CMT5567-10 TaxID=3061989 RepID=UPI0026E0A866|nr:flagellar hook-length control protein FliK [Thermoanaerobacterium sp. CMT5567-10]WKV09129.1 flagellar hook-length control protein FliK [Thermoanaerobacterium sp. CMT5567-10]
MIQVMNILNGIMPSKSDDKFTNKKVSDFKSFIKVVQNGSKDENKSFNSNKKETINIKQLSDIINMILNLINNNLTIDKVISQSNLQPLEESIINQLCSAIQNSQNKDEINMQYLVNTITKILNEKFGLNIDSKDILSLLKNTNMENTIITVGSNDADIKDDNIKLKLSTNSDDLKQQMVAGSDSKNINTEANNNEKNTNINSLTAKTDNNLKDENLNQNGNQSKNQDYNNGEDVDSLVTDKNQNISKKLDSKIDLTKDNKIIDLKPDNIVVLNDNQNKQLTVNTEKILDAKNPIQTTDIIDQIVKNINITKSDTESNIKIQLKPDFLGNMEIDIKSMNGSLTANILTDNEKVKHQIEANLNVLNSQLESKGIKIDSFNVSIDRNMQFTSQYSGQENSGEKYKNQNNNRIRINYDDYETAELESRRFLTVNTVSNGHVDVVV